MYKANYIILYGNRDVMILLEIRETLKKRKREKKKKKINFVRDTEILRLEPTTYCCIKLFSDNL